jgi:DNA ligase-1
VGSGLARLAKLVDATDLKSVGLSRASSILAAGTTTNEQRKNMALIRPLLAAKTTDEDLKKLRYPLLLSPKIDGVRALVVNGKLMSRTMKPIPNKFTQELFGKREFEGLDGELVVGNPYDPNLMQQTMSGVMSIEGKPDVKFYVFDKWNEENRVFHQRLLRVKEYVMILAYDHPIVDVPHRYVNNYEQLLRDEQECVNLGYEGVMLRDPNGPYKQNRSTLREGILLKVKRFHDAEAVILDYEPLMRNNNEQFRDERGYAKRQTVSSNKEADDCLGSFFVRCLETGQTFSVGTGFTEAQRYSYWNIRESLRGRTIKYKSFKVTGVLDKPRFPVFLGFRDERDM